jgi:type 1 glutamine amidotransferase
MSFEVNRRQWLLAGAAAWLGTGSISQLLAKTQGANKKVLFFTKSSGFEHSVIKRDGGSLSMAERILTEIGKANGFEVVASKDGRLFEPDQIGQWDAFVFETTGDLTIPGGDQNPPISPDGEKALYEAIRGGKGFMGMHCATDTFGHHGPKYKQAGNRDKGADDPYIQMIGGEFIVHGAQQLSRIDIVSPSFPGIANGFGSSGTSFTIQDEWYALKNFADDLHVILVQVTEGMKGHMYERPNFPVTWARAFGKGRVFYTSMGHREDVWENPNYQALLLGALGWATGRIDANVEPNIRKVTPKYDELPN